MPRIELTSASRYNGGIAIKRRHGSSTVTSFWVTVDGVLQPEQVTGYGPTPGERKTNAKQTFLAKYYRKDA